MWKKIKALIMKFTQNIAMEVSPSKNKELPPAATVYAKAYIRRQFADELFECVWPFCGVGA